MHQAGRALETPGACERAARCYPRWGAALRDQTENNLKSKFHLSQPPLTPLLSRFTRLLGTLMTREGLDAFPAHLAAAMAGK